MYLSVLCLRPVPLPSPVTQVHMQIAVFIALAGGRPASPVSQTYILSYQTEGRAIDAVSACVSVGQLLCPQVAPAAEVQGTRPDRWCPLAFPIAIGDPERVH